MLRFNTHEKSLSIEAAKDNAFGVQLDNGSWTGMRGLLQKRVIRLKKKY